MGSEMRIYPEKQSMIKLKSFAHFKILWFSFMVSLVFSSSFVLATQKRIKIPNITVKNITYKIDKETEKVIIELNRATTPIVFEINGNNPRIVIDIMDVLPCKGRYRTPVNGKLIIRFVPITTRILKNSVWY